MEDFNEDEIKVEEDDVVVCEECSQEFFSEQSLSQHKKKKHDKREFTCYDCGEYVVGMRKFIDHKRKHEKFDCTICSQSIIAKHRIRHLKTCKGPKENKKMETVKECDHEGCSYKTRREADLHRHKKTHEKHPCSFPDCDHIADTKRKLIAHKKKVHEVKCLTFHECGWCDFSSSHKGNVKRHELICQERKRQETSLDIQAISKDELGLLFSKTGATTITDFNQILDFFIERFGKQFFEKGAKGAVAEYCNSLEHLHESEEMIFQVTLTF